MRAVLILMVLWLGAHAAQAAPCPHPRWKQTTPNHWQLEGTRYGFTRSDDGTYILSIPGPRVDYPDITSAKTAISARVQAENSCVN